MMNADKMKNFGTGAKKILVVEDEPAICEFCDRALASEGSIAELRMVK